ncbi:hypothetical protein NDU88_013318 [Pleurodeles waltl]|uniref:Uncharacterized protein n=1 Tax=Pleurodeles waltl TaxID=8319 RepID=A0AAV7R6W8_PLEWA|nr:hypothetical protein NDU88_013316 [Pleurodeles waltl]KAJ1147071.1 hypothetical protein NDU88_013318 [Pleurodeles waltl]
MAGCRTLDLGCIARAHGWRQDSGTWSALLELRPGCRTPDPGALLELRSACRTPDPGALLELRSACRTPDPGALLELRSGCRTLDLGCLARAHGRLQYSGPGVYWWSSGLIPGLWDLGCIAGAHGWLQGSGTWGALLELMSGCRTLGPGVHC